MSTAIYVNNAGTSWPKAPGVVEAAGAALLAPPAASDQTLQAAYAETCHAFGIEQRERVLLTGSCTAALALLLHDLPLREGDVVLTSGVVHEIAPYALGNPLDLDFVQRTLRRGAVRLIAVTAASNVTAEVLPVEELGRLAREHGVPVLLDAAQTACVLPIDLKTLPVDMLVFAAHKGPLAPHGIGGLWAAPHVEFQSPAAICELTSEGTAPRCASFPSACDVGSVNLAAAAGLATALRWHRAQGEQVYARPRALAERLRCRLREQPGCQVFGAENATYTATVSFRVEKLPVAHAEAYFARRGVTLRAGQHCAPLALQSIGAPEGTLRVSFGPFNRDEDLERIAEAVAAIAR
jgi:selenocysteine lyase/cysteine desulfurase